MRRSNGTADTTRMDRVGGRHSLKYSALRDPSKAARVTAASLESVVLGRTGTGRCCLAARAAPCSPCTTRSPRLTCVSAGTLGVAYWDARKEAPSSKSSTHLMGHLLSNKRCTNTLALKAPSTHRRVSRSRCGNVHPVEVPRPGPFVGCAALSFRTSWTDGCNAQQSTTLSARRSALWGLVRTRPADGGRIRLSDDHGR